MAEYALRLASAVDTAPRVRMGDALALFPNGALKARGGLRPDGGGAVTVNAGAMTVQVEPFTAWVPGGSSGTQGGYPFILDAAKTLTITDGDAALTRTDTVAAVVSDAAFDGSGTTSAEVVVVTGTPGAGAPALPASAVALRDITVPAGLSAGTGGLSSSNLGADRRRYTVGAGAILPVASATARDALTVAAGAVVYQLDTGELQSFDGSVWSPVVETDDTGWITPNYQNGWAARDGSPAYRRLAGVVYMRGRFLRGAYNGSPAFTLPAGFRPSATMYFASPAGQGYGRVEVNTSGQVIFDTAGSNAGFQSVAGVSFPADG